MRLTAVSVRALLVVVLAFVFGLVGLASSASTATKSSATVKTKLGRVVGRSDYDGQHVFLGVPFGKQPQRFARPQLVEKSKETIDATKSGPSCPQPPGLDSTNHTSEDCLSLDIYVPDSAHQHVSPLPVMVYFYGGSFLVGSAGRYNGSALVDESIHAGSPVIVVTANYRVGPFGWLASKEVEDDQGAVLNAGLHDQRLALRWIHENIECFGGDPDKVTLWGQSAGAVSVALQLLHNGGDSEGLFRAAILHSGSQAVQPTFAASSPQIEARYQALAKLSNCSATQTQTTLDCLRKLDVDALTMAGAQAAEQQQQTVMGGSLAFPPVRDAVFVNGSPRALIDAGKSADVALLSGDVLDEGTIFTPASIVNSTIFQGLIASEASLDLRNASASTAKFLAKVLKFYPDVPELGSPYLNEPTASSAGTTGARLANRTFAPLTTNQFKRVSSFSGDLFFESQRRSLLASYLRHHPNKPLYAYKFAQDDRNSPLSVEGASGSIPGYPLAEGVAHGSDLVYLFGPTVQRSSPGYDDKLARQMKRAWISFAAFLDPNKLEPKHDWPKYAELGGKLMQWKGNK